MDNRDTLRARTSIRMRLLALLLGLTIASVVTIAYLGVNSILQAGQKAQEASSATLRTQAKENLVRLTGVTAEKNNLVLENVRQDAKNVAQYAEAVFEHPEAFARDKYWRAEDHMFKGPQGQYINGKEDTSTVFAPNSVKIDDKLMADLELASYLDLQFVPVYKGGPNRVAIYFISKYEFSRLYPNIGLGDILGPDYLATKDIFFTAGAPENNPNRQVVWTPVYNDPAGQGLLVTTVAPIYTNKGEFLGIIGIDVSLAKLGADIEAASPVAGGYSFLVNDQRRAIALPGPGYTDLLGRSPDPGEFGADLHSVKSEFTPVLDEMMIGSTGFQSVKVGERELFVAYAPLAGTRWSLATVVEAENMLQAVAALQKDLQSSTQALVLTRILPVGGMILVVAVVIGLLLTNRLVGPIQRLAMAAQQIGAGKWDTLIPQAGDDEIGVLSRAFGMMAAQVREAVASLEQRVAERTADLERRSSYLAASAEVGRAATSILETDRLIGQAVELIRERFGLYYVGLFLADEAGEWAVLRAGTGEAGVKMLARGHRLQIGGSSMIGWSIANAQARIALEAGEDAIRLATAELPDTRSEAALPLRSRGRVLGALTVQSDQPGAFDEAAIAVLQIMADQVAVALDNARLYVESQAALEATRRAYGDFSRQAWAEILRARTELSYRYAHRSTTPAQGDWCPEMLQALQIGQSVQGNDVREPTLAVPLKVRDQVIGVLHFRKSATGKAWTTEEEALLGTLADRLAQTLESAHLFEEAQRLAAREQAVNTITAKIRGVPTVNAILQRTVEELGRAFGAARASVRVQLSEPANKV